jgi:hypothetical protein
MLPQNTCKTPKLPDAAGRARICHLAFARRRSGVRLPGSTLKKADASSVVQVLANVVFTNPLLGRSTRVNHSLHPRPEGRLRKRAQRHTRLSTVFKYGLFDTTQSEIYRNLWQPPARKTAYLSRLCNVGQRLETGFGGLWLRRARVRVPSVTFAFAGKHDLYLYRRKWR